MDQWTRLCSALSLKPQFSAMIEFSPLLPSGFQELTEGGTDELKIANLAFGNKLRKGKERKQELET